MDLAGKSQCLRAGVLAFAIHAEVGQADPAGRAARMVPERSDRGQSAATATRVSIRDWKRRSPFQQHDRRARRRNLIVYGYVRVSTERQADEGVSLEEQIRRI
jgi:hypothetical protein